MIVKMAEVLHEWVNEIITKPEKFLVFIWIVIIGMLTGFFGAMYMQRYYFMQ